MHKIFCLNIIILIAALHVHSKPMNYYPEINSSEENNISMFPGFGIRRYKDSRNEPHSFSENIYTRLEASLEREKQKKLAAFMNQHMLDKKRNLKLQSLNRMYQKKMRTMNMKTNSQLLKRLNDLAMRSNKIYSMMMNSPHLPQNQKDSTVDGKKVQVIVIEIFKSNIKDSRQ